MPRYAIMLSYDGSRYNGWQIQENTPHTIQKILQDKARVLFRAPVEITGCGRTDTGVHAENYVAHFDLDSEEIINQLADPVYKWNALLPDDIVIQQMVKVPDAFHARYDARERIYYYHLHQIPHPFLQRISYYQYGYLDFDKMNKAAEILLAYRDFTCFSKLHTDQEHFLCTIYAARWIPMGGGRWRFMIRANRFLRGMVRSVVGTLLWVGKDRITLQQFEEIILSQDRKNAGPNVPAHGLIFSGVNYSHDIQSLFEKK